MHSEGNGGSFINECIVHVVESGICQCAPGQDDPENRCIGSQISINQPNMINHEQGVEMSSSLAFQLQFTRNWNLRPQLLVHCLLKYQYALQTV